MKSSLRTHLLFTSIVAVSLVPHHAVSIAAEPETKAPVSAEAPAEAKGILPVPDYSGDLFERSHLTGDWGGTRTDLANKGIQFQVDWTQHLQSVVDGGADTATQYGGNLDYMLNLDLYRMGLLPGALIKVRAETRYGEFANDKSGSIIPVNMDGAVPINDSNGAADVPIALTDLAYYQFLSEKFGVFLGKIDTLNGDPNPFASGRGVSQFMNANYVIPVQTLLMVPYSTLAAGFVAMPTPNITLTSAMMNTADSSTTSGFGEFGNGWTSGSEADIQYRLGKLPGGMNFGFVYAADRDYTEFGGRFTFQRGEGLVVPTQDNTWAAYWSGWQYFYTPEDVKGPVKMANGAPDRQGVGIFWRFGEADHDTNPIRWTLSGGVGGKGLVPGRPNDLWGVGYSYASLGTSRLTSALAVDDNSQGFEGFYNIALTPAMHLTFDLQVVDPPFPDRDTAVVLGGRLQLSF
ncbi:MAG: carbohydrate porin [Planctomycetes bacterium]|nr:carbohydrate porin [Planctomycetota bacterium]